jgi:small GTP-binding protein
MEVDLKDKFDLIFKLIIIGDTSVGKSSILNQYLRSKCKSPFSLILTVNQSSKHTVGVEFGMKFIQVNNKVIKVQIWDTAGQERYKSVTRSYFRGSIGVVIVYDITR